MTRDNSLLHGVLFAIWCVFTGLALLSLMFLSVFGAIGADMLLSAGAVSGSNLIAVVAIDPLSLGSNVTALITLGQAFVVLLFEWSDIILFGYIVYTFIYVGSHILEEELRSFFVWVNQFTISRKRDERKKDL